MTGTVTARPALAGIIDDLGGRVVCLALSKDPNAKVTILLFGPGEHVPRYVAKVPTTDAAERSVLGEAARLADLGHRDIGPIEGTVPRIVAIAGHNGVISLLDVQGTTVYIKMGGGCQGCSAADVTLRDGIEKTLREEVPEIGQILDITDHAGGTNPYYTAH